ncbi:hem-containing dehydratase protein [Xylaria palmicola]|nr:hem-containing dehydratase protein [Xylaria palmicola]
MTESAIPEHLRLERALPAKTPGNYRPPFPFYTARYPKNAVDLVMAVLGAQFPSPADPNIAKAMAKLSSFVSSGSVSSLARPQFYEVASVTDAIGYYNKTIISYWASTAAYKQWTAQSGFQQWWDALDPKQQPHGWFIEAFFPTMDRIETVFNTNEIIEGAGHMRESLSGPIAEHAYWGSMRDRLPVAQRDPLDGDKPGWSERSSTATITAKSHVRVDGTRNLAVIRSGQDWKDTSPAERELYLGEMRPVLAKGMNYLRDCGDEIGCYSCRLMDIVDGGAAEESDRTFGLAYFDNLASLERWSREHPTHLDIFGGFMRYAKKLQNNIGLRLFHEVLVLKPEQQLFEYVGCHSATGMLTGVNGHPRKWGSQEPLGQRPRG